MKIFAIGDIHGCVEELNELLDQLPLTPDSLIVFLGDYIDRGNHSRAVIDRLLQLQKSTRIVTLKGNHEAMLLDFLDHPESIGAALYILNGGGSTLVHYARQDGGFDFPPEHRQFLRSLPLFHDVEDYFFVHAGVPLIPLEEIKIPQHESILLWTRRAFLESQFKWDKLVIHGHTPVDRPEVRKNRINLDTGCVFGGSLTAIELPSMRFYRVAKKAKNEVPLLLQDTGFSSKRVARRFPGTVPVYVQKNNDVLEFETLNYNQHGLLIQERGLPKSASFKVGEQIRGTIGAPATREQEVQFQGTIVRTEARGQAILYGVKIEII